LGDGVPRSGLRVSSAHALFINGGLLPFRMLVNGASIVQETQCRCVTWYHVELDTRDVLLADSAPAEGYLDAGNRGTFANADGAIVLHPSFGDGRAARIGRSRAPFVDDPAAVESIWRGLAERAKV
jgi:Hint domain-containing protein